MATIVEAPIRPVNIAPVPRPGRGAVALKIAAATAIGLLCLAARVVNLDRYSGSYPEGIRAEQLLLMAAGFQPFRDIFSDQGPWLLQALYPGFLLFGGSLAGVRAGVVAASLIGLGGMYWLVRPLAGPIGALAALLLLGLSPVYLQFSRLAVAEVLALAPAILALACAARFQRRPEWRWLCASGCLLAVSLLLKPITIGTAGPVALAIWLADGRRLRNLALVGLLTGSVALVGMLLVGLPEIMQQIVQFRVASRGVEGWSLTSNLARLRGELQPEGFGLPLLALVGAGFAVRHREAWPLVVWVVAALATVLAHSPLHSKHFTIVVVPLVALAGYGVGRLAGLATTVGYGRWLGRAGLAVALAVMLLGAPRVLARDSRLLTSDDLFERDEARLWYPDAVDTIRRVARPDEYIVTDHAYLAYAARRLVPPELVEASATRVRAGSLTDEQAIETTERYGVRAVLLWADKLLELKRYRAWLTEHYVPVKIWAAEGETRPVLWLRNDARLAADREALRAGSAGPLRSAGSADWPAVSARIEPRSGCAGAPISVVLELEAAREEVADGTVRLALEDASGQTVDDEVEPLLGGVGRPRWLFWVGALTLPRERGPATYRVKAGPGDLRGRSTGTPLDLSAVESRVC